MTQKGLGLVPRYLKATYSLYWRSISFTAHRVRAAILSALCEVCSVLGGETTFCIYLKRHGSWTLPGTFYFMLWTVLCFPGRRPAAVIGCSEHLWLLEKYQDYHFLGVGCSQVVFGRLRVPTSNLLSTGPVVDCEGLRVWCCSDPVRLGTTEPALVLLRGL